MKETIAFPWIWERDHPWVHSCKLVSLDYSKLNFKLLEGGKKHNTDLFRRAIVFWCYNSVYVFRVSLFLCYWVDKGYSAKFKTTRVRFKSGYPRENRDPKHLWQT